jgi:hypothetical protein
MFRGDGKMTRIQCAWNPKDNIVLNRSVLNHKDSVLFLTVELEDDDFGESSDVALTITGIIELRDALDKIIKRSGG